MLTVDGAPSLQSSTGIRWTGPQGGRQGHRDRPAAYWLVGANAAVYLALGLLLFTWMEKRARRIGVLGHW